MDLHPAIPETYKDFPIGNKLRIAGIIAGRELLYAYLEFGEIFDRRAAREERRLDRYIKIQDRVGEYLDDHDLPVT